MACRPGNGSTGWSRIQWFGTHCRAEGWQLRCVAAGAAGPRRGVAVLCSTALWSTDVIGHAGVWRLKPLEKSRNQWCFPAAMCSSGTRWTSGPGRGSRPWSCGAMRRQSLRRTGRLAKGGRVQTWGGTTRQPCDGPHWNALESIGRQRAARSWQPWTQCGAGDCGVSHRKSLAIGFSFLGSLAKRWDAVDCRVPGGLGSPWPPCEG